MQFNLKNIPFQLITAVFCLWIQQIKAQPASEIPIEVTFNKTTSLIFPAVITSVDRGSRDLLAQKAQGVDNILQLKAAFKGFPETNLTVITEDGNIHEFTVYYSTEPTQKIIRLNPENSYLSHKSNYKNLNSPLSLERGVGPIPTVSSGGGGDIIFQSALTESEMETCAKKIVGFKRAAHFIQQSKHKISMSLRGVYIKEDILFCHFQLSNKSNVNYDVDFIRFYVQDKQTVKRTASQEVNKAPIYHWGNAKKIRGQTSADVVYAFPKFTIPDKKRFVAELFEENGGRHLKLLIKDKTIVNARLVQ